MIMEGAAAFLSLASGSGMDEARNIALPAERVAAWVEAARPGDELVYGSRWFGVLPAKSPTAAKVRALHAEGLVLPFQRVIQAGVERNYVVRRTARPWIAPAAPSPLAEPAHASPAAIDALFALLARAARFKRPCPTDKQLAERAGIERGEVKPALEAMVEAGLIDVAGCAAPTLRRVRIVATGETTGWVR
ncbi:hypothetical protein [Sphingomonas sp. S2-65]|uniref:hypothetical protein n=1 Tax=Sphingomonas sp. S2-65 TaxID=2903960 RepID=UPI001F3688C4|nr:hypothetical protein [Sphingomonas sp. S2-65]UYY60125.1 hypothetical protein LZ586_08625 [Sphingomonas sp. S2-65]